MLGNPLAVVLIGVIEMVCDRSCTFLHGSGFYFDFESVTFMGSHTLISCSTIDLFNKVSL